MKIFWAPLAITRVNEIADYIAEDNLNASQDWVDGILKKVERLEEFPYSGRIVPELNRKEIREIFFGNYRIIYQISKDSVSILTVRHFKQRLPLEDF
jgi:plasmid stabilization system protein ParE